jgi:hypothetical protein
MLGRSAALLALLATLTGLLPPAARAAQASREVQVAFEPSGRLFEVDRPLARRLGLFVDEYPGFHLARLYQTGDSAFVLEVTIVDGAGSSRERVPMTPEEVAALRQDIAARMAAGAPARLLDQDGRAMLVAGATMLGLGYYGWAVPVATDIGDPEAAVGLYMLVSGASFFVPFSATTNATVTTADADLALYGGSRGIAHGFLLMEAIDRDQEFDAEQSIGVAMLTSLIEGSLFYAWSRSSDLDAGTTGTIGTFGDYGGLSGIGLASILDEAGDASESGLGFAGLAGSAAGIAAGRIFGHGRSLSRGDAGVMRTSTLLGAYTGGTIGELLRAEGDPDDPWVIGAILGGAGGIAIGDRLVSGREFTHGQSRMVAYGMSAGALAGLGLAFTSSLDDGDAVLGITSLGALLGFTAVYSALRNDATAGAMPAGVPHHAEARPARLAWALDPAGLVALASARAPERAAPLVVLSWRFGELR